MSYSSIHACANDQAFLHRVTAALADEGAVDPNARIYQVIWPVAAADDIEAAYASAVAAENPDPGGDESVITDNMILSVLQSLAAAP